MDVVLIAGRCRAPEGRGPRDGRSLRVRAMGIGRAGNTKAAVITLIVGESGAGEVLACVLADLTDGHVTGDIAIGVSRSLGPDLHTMQTPVAKPTDADCSGRGAKVLTVNVPGDAVDEVPRNAVDGFPAMLTSMAGATDAGCCIRCPTTLLRRLRPYNTDTVAGANMMLAADGPPMLAADAGSAS